MTSKMVGCGLAVVLLLFAGLVEGSFSSLAYSPVSLPHKTFQAQPQNAILDFQNMSQDPLGYLLQMLELDVERDFRIYGSSGPEKASYLQGQVD